MKRSRDQAADSGVEAKRSFSIVGIGASAGRLEALEVFFKQTPADSGLAFVVVPHLDPTHSDMIDGLVVTFLDVSDARKLAVELEKCRTRLLELQNQKPG